jgi:hypothetical protein
MFCESVGRKSYSDGVQISDCLKKIENFNSVEVRHRHYIHKTRLDID